MREPANQTIYLKDYAPPTWRVSHLELDVEIREHDALVRARLQVQRADDAPADAPLILDGEELTLQSVAVDGKKLVAADYTLSADHLVIANLPSPCIVETQCVIVPQTNTKLEGLYASKTGFFTQCEAQGFRRITFYPDRPDVMARFTCTVRADQDKYPVLLSNGNCIAKGQQRGGRHWAKFEDPFPKPAYLFALVAAQLDVLEDTFTTQSGRSVQLAVYVEPGKLDQCDFAMHCLKQAMRWDETVFGLEYDLDQYVIVAVSDFNSGAMENKGLNIFNTKYILARPDTATDIDYMNIDRVVAHEYFHNWTGNRVTCRDWFQLSLKEGLTVFRDQEYGSDTYSRAVQRIQEVRGLRTAQFPEDAGPMAHPVRPPSYMEIRNFYTMTVYEKGAEVVRMQHTLLGAPGFRKGMDLYFQRHDGQAVTTDDFVAAMADANQVDLTQFKRWYSQAGTPRLTVSGQYDAGHRRYTLRIQQSCPPTPEQANKEPFHLPFAVGLVGPDGQDVAGSTRLIELREADHTEVFEHVDHTPVPSLLRNFSAPVIVEFAYSTEQLTHLMAHDSDAFNRWEAGQRLATQLILAGAHTIPAAYLEACARILASAHTDPAFAAEALTLPSEGTLAEHLEVVDPDALHAARNRLRLALATGLRAQLLDTMTHMQTLGPYNPNAMDSGKRALKNLCLSLLMELNDPEIVTRCVTQFETANNMTDRMAALTCLANSDSPERAKALSTFYAQWKDEPLVVDKWLSVQATSRLANTLQEVRRLTTHPAFDLRNPNKIYSLLRAFFSGNHVRFHAADGSGYAFAADMIIAINALNPQVAARIARCFDRWKKFDASRQSAARQALEKIRASADVSRDVAEIIEKALV